MLAYHSRMLWSLSWPMNKCKGGKKRQCRITNKGITGLVTPPKFFRKYLTAVNNLLVFFHLNLTHYLLQTVTKRRCKVNSQCWNLRCCLCALQMCSPFCHSLLISCKNWSFFFFLDCLHHCVACLLCRVRKHTATKLLIQGALAIALPLVNTILSHSLFNSVTRDVLYDIL